MYALVFESPIFLIVLVKVSPLPDTLVSDKPTTMDSDYGITLMGSESIY